MSILALDWAQQAMLNEAEPPPPLHNETFERLEKRVDDEFFHFLSNMSSFSGEFTAFANAMVRGGYCNSSKKLMAMTDESIRRMGKSIRMSQSSVANLVAAVNRSKMIHAMAQKGNFERPGWYDPRFDKPKPPKKLPVHQLMQIFDRIDTDRSGSVSTKELRKQLSTDPELQHMLGLKVRHPTRGLVLAVDMDSLLGGIDTDGSGSVSWGEWRDAVTHVSAKRVFDQVDRDSSGLVERREFAAALLKDQSVETLLGLSKDVQEAPHGVSQWGDRISRGASEGTQLEITKLIDSIDLDGSVSHAHVHCYTRVPLARRSHPIPTHPTPTHPNLATRGLDHRSCQLV